MTVEATQEGRVMFTTAELTIERELNDCEPPNLLSGPDLSTADASVMNNIESRSKYLLPPSEGTNTVMHRGDKITIAGAMRAMFKCIDDEINVIDGEKLG